MAIAILENCAFSLPPSRIALENCVVNCVVNRVANQAVDQVLNQVSSHCALLHTRAMWLLGQAPPCSHAMIVWTILKLTLTLVLVLMLMLALMLVLSDQRSYPSRKHER